MRKIRVVGAAVGLTVALGTMMATAVAQDDETWFGDWLTPTQEGAFGPAAEGLPWCVKDTVDREYVAAPDGSGKEVRNLLFTCEVVFSDPRLSGTQTTRFTERCWANGGCVNWGTMEIAGTDGGWSGWFQGLEDTAGQVDLHIVLTGSGAYEGLTNVRHASGGFYSALTQEGVVYNGDPPLLDASALPE